MLAMVNILHFLVAGLLTALFARAAPVSGPTSDVILKPRDSPGKLVFCHFMIGITSNRKSASDFDDDMKRAKSLGIDAFALNIGVDPFTDEELGYAYTSAANNGMKVFISFDFNWYSDTTQAADVGNMIKKYATSSAQLMVNGKVFVSSFDGDKLDIATVRSTAGMDLFIAPNFHPELNDFGAIDGALNWMAWPSNNNNRAPTPGANTTVADGDQAYMNALGNKSYIAPVSAWFSTHFGSEVSYSKNWVFPSDLLWYQRWTEVLTLGSQYLEIITWNDYGESHYIGPLSSPHTDDGSSKWVNDMPHGGWLDMAKPFIAAYHAGAKTVDNFIEQDQIIYWYRPTTQSPNCDSTDNTMGQVAASVVDYTHGRPDGSEDMQDQVFVVTLLKSPGTIKITSGGATKSFPAPAGANSYSVPMGVGQQSFTLERNGQTILDGTSLKDIVDTCICGIYNYNAYVGVLPVDAPPDPLQSAGIQSLKKGLIVQTCQATPSLATAPATNATAVPTQNPVPANTTFSKTAPSPAYPTAPTAISAPTTNPLPAATSPASASLPSSFTYSKTTITTAAPPISQNPSPGATTAPVLKITALSQLFPTNCMYHPDIWAGPPGSDPPEYCDTS
ncbi:hypothetical protein MMC12_008213 [Toensbergia leucococca]|nr:hypothetical protein [Toensbergia leucococca]